MIRSPHRNDREISTDMHYGAMGDVGDGFAEHFVGERGGVAFAEEEEAKDVRDGVSFGPLEIDVRHTAGRALDMNEQCGNGIGHHGAACIENAVPAEPASFHM